MRIYSKSNAVWITSRKAANVKQAAPLGDADARRQNYNVDQAASVSIAETPPTTCRQQKKQKMRYKKRFETRFKRRFRRTNVRKNMKMKILAQVMKKQTVMKYKG